MRSWIRSSAPPSPAVVSSHTSTSHSSTRLRVASQVSRSREDQSVLQRRRRHQQAVSQAEVSAVQLATSKQKHVGRASTADERQQHIQTHASTIHRHNHLPHHPSSLLAIACLPSCVLYLYCFILASTTRARSFLFLFDVHSQARMDPIHPPTPVNIQKTRYLPLQVRTPETKNAATIE